MSGVLSEVVTRELAAELKKACMNTKCEECPFSTGIYMEGPDYVYYFCELKKKPKEYDIEKIRVKQTKESKLAEEKAARKKEKQRQEREQKKKEKEIEKAKKEEKEKKKKTKENKEEDKPKKKRGRPKKVDIF